MTISSSTRKAGPFTGNDVTTAFPFAFKVFAAADLYVVHLDETTEVETVLVLNTDYTVSLNANQDSNPGGTVTLATALATDTTLTITSSISALQSTDLTNQGGFYPKVITNALDKLTILVQQLLEKADRSLALPITTSGASTELPVPSALKLVGWNATADALENFDAGALAASAGIVDWITETFNGDGSTTTFALSRNPGVASNCDVSISGVTQVPGTDFTVTSTAIVFTAAPPSGTANICVRYGSALPATATEAYAQRAEDAATAVGLPFRFDSSTSMADPGTGDFRLNNATVASVTAIAVSAQTSDTGNPDVSGYVSTWDAATGTHKGHITLRKSGDTATFAVFSVTSVTDNTTWLQLAVTHVASNGTWSNTDQAYAAFARTGDKGADGIGAGDFLADGTVPMTGSLVMGANTKIIFEGTTADDYEVTLDPGEPTADRTIALPNASGTVAVSATAPITLSATGGISTSMATSRVLGRSTAGTGVAEELTLSQVLDLVGSAAQGDILYRDTSGWARLGAGTSGYYLKTQGAGANPTWDSASTTFASTSEVTGTHTTGTITSGTAALTVASGTGISNGDLVVGEGITLGTTVSSGGGTTSLTLSANANASLSSDPVAFYKATKALSPGNAAGMLARAWVNFNGTGTVAIRAAYNVTSITDNNPGDYTVNFTTALPDANYAVVGTGNSNTSGGFAWVVDAPFNAAPTVSAVRIATSSSSALTDLAHINVAVFR